MKIALIHLNLATESGDPRMVFLMAQEFRKAGHTVVIYCAEFDAQASFPRLNHGLDVRVIAPAAPLSSVRGAIGIAAKLKERVKQIRLSNDWVKRVEGVIEKDFDYLVCENDYSYKLGRFYKKIRPEVQVVWIMNNPPFFHSRKDTLPAELFSRGIAFFEKMSARRYASGIDRIIVYSEELKKIAGAVGRPVRIIYNPVDLDRFFAHVKQGIGAGKPIRLLGVGALSPQRRFEDILSAGAILRKRGYDARVTLICKDYWGNGRYRNEFESFAKTLGAGDFADIHFEGANEEDYLAAMRNNDIFVLPNNIRIWGVGAFEAMAAGLPLIVSRVTAVAEILLDGVNALLVDALQPEQIADQVEKLAKDPKFYFAVASAGQKLVTTEMAPENFAREILKSI